MSSMTDCPSQAQFRPKVPPHSIKTDPSFRGETDPGSRRNLLTGTLQVAAAGFQSWARGCVLFHRKPGRVALRSLLAFFIGALTVLIIAPTALAVRVDVGARVVGLIVAGPTTITFGPPTYPGFFNLDVESEVRFDSSTSLFHYYYMLTDNTGADPVGSFAVAGEWLPESPGLDWGIVTGETSAGVWLDPPPGDIAFGATMTANFSDAPGAVVGGLHTGESITIYAQSLKPPALMPGAALGFLFTAG